MGTKRIAEDQPVMDEALMDRTAASAADLAAIQALERFLLQVQKIAEEAAGKAFAALDTRISLRMDKMERLLTTASGGG